MPWTDPLADPDELRRCMRDVIALSTLPKAWRNYNLPQIGDSIADSVFTMLAADFVLIILPDHDTQRSGPDVDPASLDHVRTVLKRERATSGDDQRFIVANGSSGPDLHVATAPIGLRQYAVLAAGSFRVPFPTETEQLLLTTGANQATIAMHWLGDTDRRRFTTLAQQSTDFIGITSEQRTIELAEQHNRFLGENNEREQSDLRLRKLRDEMFQIARFTAAGQMAASIAHELTQPLTAIINSVNATKRLLARADRASLAIAQDVTGEAAAEALRASEILRGLRHFVRLDEKERRIEVLSLIIEEAGALALGSAAPPTANLKFELDARATHAFVNRVQIQLVLINLIRNALEAMADQEEREITLATRMMGDGMIEVAVADIGPGISEEIARQLFEPFVSSKHDGMGLGLSISRSIIETHGGRLTAESKAGGGGTSFRFTVPSDGAADAS
jgi:C4-dicarboxylate-specific signal transduction histidine kinase